MKSLKAGLALLLLFPAASLAADMTLSTAGAAYAPPEVSKNASRDPAIPLSKDERKDLLGEFNGLMYLALEKAPYDRWKGKTMADCVSSEHAKQPASGTDAWRYQCEIITGQGNAYYYFYPVPTRKDYTLQKVDIQLDASDPGILEDLRPGLQSLLGRGTRVHENARHWETEDTIADLYLDKPRAKPQGIVRFVWSRAPLVNPRQAWSPRRPPLSDKQARAY